MKSSDAKISISSLLADGIAEIIMADILLALKVFGLGKLAKLCSLRFVGLHLLTVKE